MMAKELLLLCESYRSGPSGRWSGLDIEPAVGAVVAGGGVLAKTILLEAANLLGPRGLSESSIMSALTRLGNETTFPLLLEAFKAAFRYGDKSSASALLTELCERVGPKLDVATLSQLARIPDDSFSFHPSDGNPYEETVSHCELRAVAEAALAAAMRGKQHDEEWEAFIRMRAATKERDSDRR
jgi:hypothetical protein